MKFLFKSGWQFKGRIYHETNSRKYTAATDNVRVRFAPSPTGFLHLGGLRTALYNYLFARSKNGTFILRVEDTDRTRYVEGAVQKLEYDLQWTGMTIDEGPSVGGNYGPYTQSERLSLYNKEVSKLLESGMAYRCYCSETRLDLLRRNALRRQEVPKYDNRCRHLSLEEIDRLSKTGGSHCIRFKLDSEIVSYHDIVYGDVTLNIAEVESDPVIMKSDGYPTYHFANVVDDHHMRITHVLRGVEWQMSTLKHLLLYKAFDWTPPEYAHLPLLMNVDGTKLSKRQRDMTVEKYRDNGLFPGALVNFMTICGGGFSGKENASKTYSLDELAKMFDINLVNSNNCQIPYDRLNEYNHAEFCRLVDDEEQLNKLVKEAKVLINREFINRKDIFAKVDDEKLKTIMRRGRHRIFKLLDLVGCNFLYLWTLPSTKELAMFEAAYFDSLDDLIAELQRKENFMSDSFGNFFKEFSTAHNVNYKKFMKFLRSSMSGLKDGPGVSEMMENLGKDEVIERLKRAKSLQKVRIPAEKQLVN